MHRRWQLCDIHCQRRTFPFGGVLFFALPHPVKVLIALRQHFTQRLQLGHGVC
jgi:hypothetical protein